MARVSSRAFKKLRTDFRAQCAAAQLPCWICGMPIDYTAASDDYANGDRFELDHFYPVSKRPELQEDPANFRPSHASCNATRGDDTNITTLAGTLSRDWLAPR